MGSGHGGKGDGSGGLGVLLQPEWFCDSMGGHRGGGLTVGLGDGRGLVIL